MKAGARDGLVFRREVEKRTAGTVVRLWLVASLLGCAPTIPQSVRMFAADLTKRAAGQYLMLDGDVRWQLVYKDATLPCAIDVADGVAEKDSDACRCAWATVEADCADWLGLGR